MSQAAAVIDGVVTTGIGAGLGAIAGGAGVFVRDTVRGVKRGFEAIFGDEETQPYPPVQRSVKPKMSDQDMVGEGGPVAGGGALLQLVNTRSKWHRKKRPATLYKRVLYRQPPYVTLFMGGINKFGVTDASASITSGDRFFKLKNVQQGGVSGNSKWPLHMFDLTARTVPSGGTQRYYGYQLYQTTTAPNNMIWAGLDGKSGDGNTTSYPAIWRSNITDPSSSLGKAAKTVLGNVRVEFLLQGCKGYPVTFQIWVMKFADRRLDPMHMYYEEGNSGNDDANEFYSSLIRRDVCNPMMSMPAMVEMYGRAVVLYKRNYTIMPDASTNYDVTAGQIRAKLDINLNRYLHYDWVPRQSQVSFNTLDDPNWNPAYPGYGNDSGNPDKMAGFLRRPEDRIWLLVKASNYAGKTTDAESDENRPSYDMRILTTHTLRQSNA